MDFCDLQSFALLNKRFVDVASDGRPIASPRRCRLSAYHTSRPRHHRLRGPALVNRDCQRSSWACTFSLSLPERFATSDVLSASRRRRAALAPRACAPWHRPASFRRASGALSHHGGPLPAQSAPVVRRRIDPHLRLHRPARLPPALELLLGCGLPQQEQCVHDGAFPILSS